MNKYKIESLKKQFPQGTRVKLGFTEGENDMPKGLEGTVLVVDDIGNIHVDWDNGRTLAIVPEDDSFEKINQNMDVTDKEQGMSM